MTNPDPRTWVQPFRVPVNTFGYTYPLTRDRSPLKEVIVFPLRHRTRPVVWDDPEQGENDENANTPELPLYRAGDNMPTISYSDGERNEETEASAQHRRLRDVGRDHLQFNFTRHFR